MTNAPPKQKRPRQRRFRSRYNIAARCVALLDEEIAKLATTGGVTRSRQQMLDRLLRRGVSCTCDADERPLPPPKAPSDAQVRCSLDINMGSSNLLRIHLQRLVYEGDEDATLNRHQLLHKLVYRAVRCTCPPRRRLSEEEYQKRHEPTDIRHDRELRQRVSAKLLSM